MKGRAKKRANEKISSFLLEVLKWIGKSLEDASVKSYLWNTIHQEEQAELFLSFLLPFSQMPET